MEQSRRSEIKLCDLIRRLREAYGITQEQMAREMSLTVRTIAKWESGEVESLPAYGLLLFRHLAIRRGKEDLAAGFDEMLFARSASETAPALYGFLPRNRIEIEVMEELLARLRANDPAIDPLLIQIHALREQRRTEEELAGEKRARQKLAEQQGKALTLRDRIMAMKKAKSKRNP